MDTTDKLGFFCTHCVEAIPQNDPRHERLCPKCKMFTLVPMSLISELSIKGSSLEAIQKLEQVRKYYLITLDNFETVVPYTDAADPGDAISKSQHTLQAWYFSKQGDANLAEALSTVTILTHNQYVDWLRRGE